MSILVIHSNRWWETVSMPQLSINPWKYTQYTCCNILKRFCLRWKAFDLVYKMRYIIFMGGGPAGKRNVFSTFSQHKNVSVGPTDQNDIFPYLFICFNHAVKLLHYPSFTCSLKKVPLVSGVGLCLIPTKSFILFWICER